MFPSTPSLGHLPLKSVRETAHIGEEEAILPAARPCKLFPPAPPTGKSQEPGSKPRKCRRRSK